MNTGGALIILILTSSAGAALYWRRLWKEALVSQPGEDAGDQCSDFHNTTNTRGN